MACVAECEVHDNFWILGGERGKETGISDQLKDQDRLFSES